MSKFIEIVEGFSINVDEIVSVKEIEPSILLIETATREYKVPADFRTLMNYLDDGGTRARQLDAMTRQFFGG